ncbi:MAG: serine hydrolase domain-containing protein [Kangiellaceae bacterium]
MAIKLTNRILISTTLLFIFSGYVAANSDQDNTIAEATAAEAELAFRDIPLLENAFIDTAPEDRKDRILVGKLGVDDGKKAQIIQLAKEIGKGKYGKYDSLLISHAGKLVFESYHLRGRINLPHGQASAVKAYTSMILGRAIQMGYLTMADLDRPIISFLKELDTAKLVTGAEKITLHKALTMRGGLNVNDDEWSELEKNNPQALKGQSMVQTLLERSKPITSESQIYKYGNFNPTLVMTVIDAVVPGTAQDFIKNEILDKLDITDYIWRTSVNGLPVAGSRVSMKSRDMVKFGTVVLNKGKWNGKQLISAEYLAKAIKGMVKPTEDWMPDSYRYGYFWYQSPIKVGSKSYNASFAWGGGGQRVIVVDELDLIVVITGHDREDQIMDQISKIILPAFVQ